MGKLAMAALLLAAFLYAAWLVIARRTPPVGDRTGRARVFLLMTLYFMAWMGVAARAGEAATFPSGNGTAAASADDAVASASLKDAWSVLGMLNRHYIVAVLGTDEEREAFRSDKARYDEANRVFREKAGALYDKMRKLEYCEECLKEGTFSRPDCGHETAEQRKDRLARYRKAKSEFEKNGEPHLKALRKMQDHMSKTWRRHLGDEEEYLGRNRRLFDQAVAEERALGRLTAAAAEVLRMAYDSLEFHSRRVQATCYFSHPPEYAPRAKIGDSIRRIAALAAEGRLDEGAIAQARTEIARNVAMLRRLGLENEYEFIPIETGSGESRAYRKPPGMAAEVAEKMADPELAAAVEETAGVIVRLAREMPGNWGLRQED